MYRLLLVLILVNLLSCNDNPEGKQLPDNNLISGLTNSQAEKIISLKLVDSVEKSSKEYVWYSGTMTTFSPPYFSTDSIYTIDDDYNIEAKKFITQGVGNDICYNYSNGKCNKFIIRHDNSKIYGYNHSNGGSLEFIIENPFAPMDGFMKILYADTSVIFLLDDNLYRNVRLKNDPNPDADVIYRYDLAKKQKTEFFRTASIRAFGALYNSTHFYITKVNGNRFLFAGGVPSLDNKNTASINALSYIFDAEAKTLNDGALISILNVANRTLYQIPDPYNSCLFQLNASYKVPATATTIDYSSSEDLEYISIGLENLDVHIQKNPFFFTNEFGEINQIGNLYFLKFKGIHFVTKDLLNFYLIPFNNNKMNFNHIIYLPKQKKYCYIEIDNNRSGKIYIYEILNLDNNIHNL